VGIVCRWISNHSRWHLLRPQRLTSHAGHSEQVPFSISLIRNNQEWGSEYLEKVPMASLDTSHIVKYYCSVHIVTRKHLRQAMENCPDAANEIKAWAAIIEVVRWRDFQDVRSVFKDADSVDGYVIFNIRHNRYRLVTVIHYAKATNKVQTHGHVYIRSFLTHKEYDNRSNWDRRYGK